MVMVMVSYVLAAAHVPLAAVFYAGVLLTR